MARGRHPAPDMMEFHEFVLDGVNHSDASVASLIIDANHKFLKWPELLLTAEEDDDAASIPRERKIRRAIQNYYEWCSKHGTRDELRVAQHKRAGVMVDELDDLVAGRCGEALRRLLRVDLAVPERGGQPQCRGVRQIRLGQVGLPAGRLRGNVGGRGQGHRDR